MDIDSSEFYSENYRPVSNLFQCWSTEQLVGHLGVCRPCSKHTGTRATALLKVPLHILMVAKNRHLAFLASVRTMTLYFSQKGTALSRCVSNHL